MDQRLKCEHKAMEVLRENTGDSINSEWEGPVTQNAEAIK